MSARLTEQLMGKIRVLGETAWRGTKIAEPQVVAWLANFKGEVLQEEDERLHALFLLGHFMFFDLPQFRELLRVVYRDLFQYPLIQKVRSAMEHLDFHEIERRVSEEEEASRFIGLGSPSESGSLLLYFFRQVNSIPVRRFLHGHQVFTRIGDPQRVSVRDSSIRNYVFIDDLCGSGDQAIDYSSDIVVPLKSQKPDACASYFVLFATSAGIARVRKETAFDNIECVFELDASFKTFSPLSRIFATSPPEIDAAKALRIFSHYGNALTPKHPLGYKDCQLLLGFWHNTPDNTLPTIWYKGPKRWTPIFDRFPKI